MTVTTLAQAVERHLELDNGDCVHRRWKRGRLTLQQNPELKHGDCVHRLCPRGFVAGDHALARRPNLKESETCPRRRSDKLRRWAASQGSLPAVVALLTSIVQM